MKLILSILTIVMFGFGAGIAGAADPMSDKEATPRLGERFTKDTIKGTLMKMDGDYSSIKDTEGKESKIHVDKGTKLESMNGWRLSGGFAHATRGNSLAHGHAPQ